MENFEMAITKEIVIKREKLAEILQTARVQKGMTQEELAEKSDCTQATIQRIETAKFSPRMEQLFLILEALELEMKIGDEKI